MTGILLLKVQLEEDIICNLNYNCCRFILPVYIYINDGLNFFKTFVLDNFSQKDNLMKKKVVKSQGLYSGVGVEKGTRCFENVKIKKNVRYSHNNLLLFCLFLQVKRQVNEISPITSFSIALLRQVFAVSLKIIKI